jgi:putative zinc finger/helix-turn-helix YgiT family protein
MRKECPICETERDLQYGRKSEIFKVRGEEITVESKVYYCPEGDHYFSDIEDEEQKFQNAYREYRNRKNLLQPEEIKQIREKYGLSQRGFARFLGWGEITIQRYEAGALQDNAHNNLLYIIKDFDNFKKIFELRKKDLTDNDIKRIKKRLKDLENEANQLTLDFLFKMKWLILQKERMPIEAFLIKHEPVHDEYVREKYYHKNLCQRGELALAA